MRMFVQVGRKGTGWHGEETLDVGHGVFVLLFPPSPLSFWAVLFFVFFPPSSFLGPSSTFASSRFPSPSFCCPSSQYYYHRHLHCHHGTYCCILVICLALSFFISCSRCCRFISLYILWQGNYAVAIVYCRRIIHQPDQTRRIFHFPMYRAMARTVEETALL